MQEYKERHGTLILAIQPEVGHFRPDNWWWRSLGVRLLGGRSLTALILLKRSHLG
jgi:hypothetical protein